MTLNLSIYSYEVNFSPVRLVDDGVNSVFLLAVQTSSSYIHLEAI